MQPLFRKVPLDRSGADGARVAPPDLAQTKITLSLKDVSLYDAVRYVAKLAMLVVEAEPATLLLRAAGVVTDFNEAAVRGH